MPSRLYLRLTQALLILHALTSAACGSDSPAAPIEHPEPSRAVKSIRLTPEDLTVEIGQALAVSAKALDEAGQEVPGVRVKLGKLSHDIFSLGEGDVIVGTSLGAGVLVAEAGFIRQYFSVAVVEPAPATLTLDADTLRLTVGDMAMLNVELRDADGNLLGSRPLQWISADTTIARVSPTGSVMAMAEGRVAVQVAFGALSGEAIVIVSPPPVDFGGLLLFVSYDPQTGYPRVFRANANDVDGSADPVFQGAGTHHPAVSPDGQRIAFTCASTHGPAICVSNVDGYQVVELTGSDTFHEDQPTWSPDGQFIAFRRWPHGATPGPFNPTDIWVMRANGTAQVNLTADAGIQANPVWAPAPVQGESRIAYVEETIVDGYLRSRLWTMRADGTDRQALTANAAREDLQPSWSPDAREIVFVRRGGEHFGDLIVIDVATGVERELFATRLADEQLHPVWSPNGAFIAFTSMHEPSPSGNYRRQVYTVRADGSQLTRRSVGESHKEGLAWWSTQ